VYCLSLLTLLKVFRRSVVRNKKTHNGAGAYNGAIMRHCVFYMDLTDCTEAV